MATDKNFVIKNGLTINGSEIISSAGNLTNIGTISSGAITSTGTVTATGGNSTNWNTAYGWGNHASQSYATQSYVGTQISNLVDSSPSALNTLNELAAALGDDANFSTTVTNSIAGKLSLTGGTLSGNLAFSDDGEGISFYGGESIKKTSGTGIVVTALSTRSLDTLLQIDRGSGGTRYSVYHEGYHPEADTLTTARTIGGVSFNGSANINLPGVNTAGNQNTSGTSAGLSGTPNITVGTIASGAITVDAGTGADAVNNLRMGSANSGANKSSINFQNSAGSEIFAIDYTNSGTTLDINSDLGGSILTFTRPGGIVINQDGNDHDIRIESDTNTNAFFFEGSSGNVGIGTSAPERALHVVGGIHLPNNNIISWDQGNGTLRNAIYVDSGDDMIIGDANFDDIYFSTGQKTKTVVIKQTTGNVGIGTTSPSNKLHVHGGGTTSGGDSIYSIFAKSDAKWMFLHSGGTDPAVGWDTGGSMRFGTATSNVGAGFSEKMRINSSGNVGVGTTNPLQKLQVDGSIYSNGGEIFVNTNKGITAVGNLIFKGHDGSSYFEGMRLASTGNVGIGTTSPNDGKLQVYGNSTSDWAGYFYNQSTSGIGLHVETNAHGAEQLLRLSSLNGSGGSNTVKMVVRADGNVGIGTTSPTAKLQVDGAIVSEGGSFASAQEGSITDVGLVVQKNDYIYSDDNNYLRKIIGHASTGHIEIGQNATGLIGDINLRPGTSGNIKFFGSGSEDVRIDSSGNVGIGTSSPNAKLEIKGASSTNYLQFNNSSDAELFRVDSNFRWAWGTTTPTQAFDMRDNSGNAFFALDRSNARVGIGTTSPTFGKLQVNGSKYVLTDSGQARGGVHVSPDSSATSGQYGGAISFSGGGAGSAAIASINDGGSDHDSVGIAFITHPAGTGSADAQEKMRITEDGNVGIGTTSPSAPLHIDAAGMGDIYSGLIQNSTTDTDHYNAVRFMQGASGSATGMIGTGGSTTGNAGFRNTFVVGTQSANSLVLATSDTEHMRIDPSGNVLVNKTASGSLATAGFEFASNNTLRATKGSSAPAEFNRLTDDGDIAIFYKDTSIIGSIGNISTRMYIGSGDTGIFFDSIRNQIQPNNPSTGSNINATIDLGRDVFKFKNLYLSGYASVNALASPDGTSIVFPNNNGNVMVGSTITPGAKLDVKSQLNMTNSDNVSLFGLKGTRFGYGASYRVLQIGDGASSISANIAIGVDLSTNASGSFGGSGESIYFRNNITFRTPNSANNGFHSYMTMKDNNVGIGTDSPSSKLQIMGGTSGVDQISLSSNLSDNTVKYAGLVMTMFTNNTAALIGAKAQNGITSLFYGSSGSDHRGVTRHIWYTNTNYNSTSGNTESMRIDSSGNLMVGITSAISNATQTIYKSNLDYGLFIRKGDGTTGSTNKYIGFDISGGGTHGGSITNSSSGNAQFTVTSDERLKENIEDVTGCLDKIMSLKPSSYTLKQNNLDVPYGFIAQNVETVLPEFVSENEEGYKQISDGLTSGYIAVLTKAIQEQQTQIEALQSEINELKHS